MAVYHVTSTGGSGETGLALNGGAGVQLHQSDPDYAGLPLGRDLD